MSKVKKPTPITSWYDEVDQTEHQCVTTEQAEAYAAERVREALEEAASIVDGRRSNGLSTDLRSVSTAIRALITKE